MKNIYIEHIARLLQVKEWQVENCAKLFEEGATIPFVSRYRKERTGGLDEVAVAEIRHWSDVFAEMEKRKATILETIEQAGGLTSDLRSKIENSVESREIEDLYLPFKPKRRTRATAAKEAGLEPLADKMYDVSLTDPVPEARKYVGDKISSVEDALAGARDIIAERLSETASVRETLRQIFKTRRIVTKATKKAVGQEAMKYRSYFDYSESLERIAPHRLLAILRAEDEGFINVRIDADAEKCGKKIYYDFCQERRYPAAPLAEQIHLAFDDAFKRLLEPSISNEVLKEAKEKADIESIRIFGENLRQLLLAPPVGQKRVLAIDPGFRTGCKVVCLDEQGNLLHNEAIFPHPPANEKVKAIQALISVGFPKEGIEDVLQSQPGSLSVGENQRIAFAQVLIKEPKIVVLDEPTGTMDPITKVTVAKAVLKARKDLNETFIVVSHDMDFILNCCDRGALMKDGKIQYLGPADVLVEKLKEVEKEILDAGGEL